MTALDRLYLADAIPMLVVWGGRDPIVPARHAETVRRVVPSARIEVFRQAGHWPHLDEPDRFADVLLDFIATTEPAAHDRDSWRSLLSQEREGRPDPPCGRFAPSVSGVEHWDVVVVGGGPAGAACAAAARQADSTARVLVLDRADFPRDKVCGDGIAPEAFDVLADLGIGRAGLTAGYPAVERLRLRSPGGATVERAMPAPAYVVPRAVLDERLLTAALASGAEFRRHNVHRLDVHPTHVDVDGVLEAARRRRGRRRGVGRPPDGGHPPEPPDGHRDRDPRLRARAGRGGGRPGDHHHRAALAGLRLVVPARATARPTSATANWSRRGSPAAGSWPGSRGCCRACSPSG